MPDKELVQVSVYFHDLSEGGSEQASPQLALDGDRWIVAFDVIQPAQRRELSFIARSAAEAGADFVIGGRNATCFEDLRLVAEPLVQLQTIFGVRQRERIR